MLLKEILKGLEYEVIKGNNNIEIKNVINNSKEAVYGDLFVCLKGYKTDGHKYIDSAINKGCAALIIEDDVKIQSDVTVIKVKDSRIALAVAASNFYNNPSKKLKLIGVTGTNGKTTTVSMLKSILENAGYKVGLLGTVANYIGDKKISSERTTPDSLELHKLFNEMVNEKVDYCVMEVSSHSLYLNRVYGLEFETSIFTNLTQDHLDFHVTMENYFEAKRKLFNMSKKAVINIDDAYGERLYSLCRCRTYGFSINKSSDFMALDIRDDSKGTMLNLKTKSDRIENIFVNMPGRYNVLNAIGAATACLIEGVSKEAVINGIGRVYVDGRCENLTAGLDIEFDVLLDYAHTPDGLENILKSVREFTKGRVICVFGCGGDRDITKRPQMGLIASNLADIAIVTSDNPRSENPKKIIDDIVNGIQKDNCMIEEDRKLAIKKAITIADKTDVVLIAGKGHETYQILKDKTINFNEKEIVKSLLLEKIQSM